MSRNPSPRTLIASTLAALAITAMPALAADLPGPGMVAAAPVAPVDWTGFYAGIQGGYIRGGKQTLHTAGTRPSEQAIVDVGGFGAVGFSTSGFTVGGALGYNYQFTPVSGFVVGAQADLLYTSLDRERTTRFVMPGVGGLEVIARQNLDYLGMARGRLGYAFDRVLVYGTGGFAYGGTGFKGRTNLANPIYNGILDGGSHHGVATGFVYGGGVEFKLPRGAFGFVNSDNLSFKAEYLRYDLGRQAVPILGKGPVFGPGGSMNLGHAATATYRNQGQMVSVGINYGF